MREGRSLQQGNLRIIISGGGTGGHIFPAIAIANALKKMNTRNEILFVGAKGRMEMEKVPAAGYTIEGLDISGIQRRLSFKNVLLPFKILKSILKSRGIIKRFSPDVAIGVGGYASGPLLYAASLMNVPTLIQEQNSYAGVTNKILAKKAGKICVAFLGMEKFFPKSKIVVTGNPVREEMTKIEGKRDEALGYFGLNKNKKTVLVIGGSLGSLTINTHISESLNLFSEKNYQLIWQTGKSFSARADQLIQSFNPPGVKNYDFIQRMDYAFASADVIISRAGASSVSELCLVAKPVILIPSPNVAEDHQTKNALALVNNNAALLVSDAEVPQKLIPTLFNLLADESQMKILANNIAALAIHDSADKIAQEVYKLATIET